MQSPKDVKASPVGPGEITNWSMAGFPEVNGIAVAWCEFGDGTIFDPHNLRRREVNEATPTPPPATGARLEMMMTTFTLTNDFHNTSVTIRCKGLMHMHGEVTIRPSVGQIHRTKKALCGIDGCTCSGDAGTRGTQRTENDNRLVVDCSALYAAR